MNNNNNISGYIHCGLCLKEIPEGISPKHFQRVNVGWTKEGLQVWCVRHNCNVMNIDFEGHTHPADTTIPKNKQRKRKEE